MKGRHRTRDGWKLAVAEVAFVPLDALYQRATYVLRHEGWRAFIRQGFSYVLGRFFSCGDYYIYEKELNPDDQSVPIKPGIDCIMKVVSTPGELDDLKAHGYSFKAMVFKPKLEKGAIAFCLFVGRELASVTWVAPNKEAKVEIDYVPFAVDFERGEVCSGASVTDPSYRGKGLLGHTYSYIFRYLARSGLRKDKFSIAADNVASHKAHARLNPRVTGKGRYLKILRWESWKEQPTGEIDQ